MACERDSMTWSEGGAVILVPNSKMLLSSLGVFDGTEVGHPGRVR